MYIETDLLDRISDLRCKLDSLRPLDRSILEKLYHEIEIDMTYNSTAIEGNTLTVSETRRVLEYGITVGGKTLREHLEVTNHRSAMGFIESLVSKPRIEVLDTLNLHALVIDRIDPVNAGTLRRGRVYISGSSFIPPKPSAIPELMSCFSKRFDQRPEIAVEEGALLHMEFVNIHPFVDGNGRCARLLLNLYLMRNGYPPIVVKKIDRKRYIDTIVSSQVRGDHAPFVNFVAMNLAQALELWIDAFSSEPKDYISLFEAARRSRYSQEYLSLLARTGRVPAVKFGRNWKIAIEDLERYEREHGR
ncbi:MAG: Fic family protein [Candidatus Thermoplasmatota archaeon]|nr:Fic family protein [Candidatus Thermoplasmatota archaeon]